MGSSPMTDNPGDPIPSVLDALPVPACLVDAGGVVRAGSASWASWASGLGLEARDDLRAVSARGFEGVAAGLRDVLAGAAGTTDVALGDGRGSVRMTRAGSGVVVVVTPPDRAGDATETSRLQRLLASAQDSNRMKDEFLGALSHELRPPLNAIVGWAHLLRSGTLREDEATRALDSIDRAARAQARLISDILDVSSIVAGRVRLELAPVDLGAVVEAALDTARPAAEAKSVWFQPVVDTAVGPVLGDAERLRQVVWNLLSNAVKFTPRGGRVRVELARDGAEARITVEDTGQGIARDYLPQLFAARGEEAPRPAGSGLGVGLSIVRHLVEQHGGGIDAGSAGQGYGAVFTVRLPLMATSVTAPPPAPRRDPAFADPHGLAGTMPRLDRVRILLVEDEDDAREIIARILEQQGAVVIGVASAGEALEALARERPDVLLSDIGMPIEDGYSLIRKVRQLPADDGGRVPAAALTAFARAEDRMQALLAGFQLHLPKPVQPAELLAVVSSLAGRA